MDDQVEFDAPPVRLFGDAWRGFFCGRIRAWQGPGDFVSEWDSVDEAVDDIIDFFLGDPERMNAKVVARKRWRATTHDHQPNLMVLTTISLLIILDASQDL